VAAEAAAVEQLVVEQGGLVAHQLGVAIVVQHIPVGVAGHRLDGPSDGRLGLGVAVGPAAHVVAQVGGPLVLLGGPEGGLVVGDVAVGDAGVVEHVGLVVGGVTLRRAGPGHVGLVVAVALVRELVHPVRAVVDLCAHHRRLVLHELALAGAVQLVGLGVA